MCVLFNFTTVQCLDFGLFQNFHVWVVFGYENNSRLQWRTKWATDLSKTGFNCHMNVHTCFKLSHLRKTWSHVLCDPRGKIRVNSVILKNFAHRASHKANLALLTVWLLTLCGTKCFWNFYIACYKRLLLNVFVTDQGV